MVEVVACCVVVVVMCGLYVCPCGGGGGVWCLVEVVACGVCWCVWSCV